MYSESLFFFIPRKRERPNYWNHCRGWDDVLKPQSCKYLTLSICLYVTMLNSVRLLSDVEQSYKNTQEGNFNMFWEL